MERSRAYDMLDQIQEVARPLTPRERQRARDAGRRLILRRRHGRGWYLAIERQERMLEVLAEELGVPREVLP